MAPNTINDIFYAVVERQSPRVALYRQGGSWIPVSSQELYRNVVGVARTLQKWGVHKGDRVAILSENRAEWAVADFACMLLGAVVVPIYATLTAEQTAHILRDCGARVLFVSTASQFTKFVAAKSVTQVEKVAIMDEVATRDATTMRDLMHSGPMVRDAEMDTRARAILPDDLATIIYTSGTTGIAKGAMLTHGNMASNVEFNLKNLPFSEDDVGVSFLPLAHVTARHVDYGWYCRGVTLAYCPVLEELPTVLNEIRPSIFVAVPRLYEKIYAQVQLHTRNGLKRSIYQWAVKVGHSHREHTLNDRRPASLSWNIANLLVFSKLRRRLGGRIRVFYSGGAPLGRELAEWFADMGIRIDEGYGLTETSPMIALNTPNAHKLGTVGKPLANVEVRIAPDGELLVRGSSIFKSYWNLPEETRNAFEGDWFKTGDIASLDSEGFLSITDRKKDLLKTSGGKFITPQPIEKSLVLNPLVASAIVVGDRRKFPAAILQPNFSLLEDWARENTISFSSREDLLAAPRVHALYQGILAEVNSKLARFEQLKKFLLVPEEFSIANGTMTASMKLRRRHIEDLYRKQIDALYDEPAVAVTEST